MRTKKALLTEEALLHSKSLEKIQEGIDNIEKDSFDNVLKMILESNEINSEESRKIIVSMILFAHKTQFKRQKLIVDLAGELIKIEEKFKNEIIQYAFLSFSYNRSDLVFVAKCIDAGFLSTSDVVPYLKDLVLYSEESFVRATLFYFIFAPEIHTSEELKEKYIFAVEKCIDSQYMLTFHGLRELFAQTKLENFDSLRKFRDQGYFDGTLDEIIINDDVETLKKVMSMRLNRGTGANIYESSPFLILGALPIMSAAFYCANKCFDYLSTVSNVDCYAPRSCYIDHFAAAGGNIEVLRKLEGREHDQTGCIQIAIQNHQNKVVDYFLNERKIKLTEVSKHFDTPLASSIQSDNLYVFNKFFAKTFDANEKDKKGMPIIFESIGNGSFAILSTLMELPNFDINITDKYQNTLLHTAVTKSQAAIIKVLLSSKAIDINAKDKKLQSAMHIAAMNGELDIIKLFVNDERANLNIGNRIGSTPLIVALENNQIHVVDYLMSNSKVKISTPNTSGVRLIHVAVEKHNIHILNKILERKIDINAKTKKDGLCPLHIACEMGFLDIVEILLAHPKGNVNVQSKKGFSGLHYAIENKHMDIFKYLLDKGANYNIKSVNNETPMHIALQNPTDEFAKILIELPDIDVKSETANGWTTLHYAAMNGLNEIFFKLVEMGCDVNAKNNVLKTPIHYATQEGRFEIVKKLLSCGADPTVIDEEKRTPLHYAAENGHVEACELLLKQEGINVNAKAFEKLTPLHLAAQCNRVKTVQLLLKQKDIDTTVKNEDGLTPLQCAEQAHADEVIKLLK